MPAFIRAVADAFAGRESGAAERVLFDFRGMWVGQEGLEGGEGEGGGDEGSGQKEGNGAAAAATNGAGEDKILEGWRRFDDVIMGGKSGSEIIPWNGESLAGGMAGQ